MMIYRIVPKEVWIHAESRIPRAPIDDQDGYIHLSSMDTVLETANLYFTEEQNPVVLCFDENIFGSALIWEDVPSRGASFPHLYAENLLCDHIYEVKQLNFTPEGFQWGEVIS